MTASLRIITEDDAQAAFVDLQRTLASTAPQLRRSAFFARIGEIAGQGLGTSYVAAEAQRLADAHDLIDDRFQDELAAVLQRRPITFPPERIPRFKIEMLDEIVIGDDPTELVQGLLPMGPGFGVVYGPPKSLKSFLLTYLCLHIADHRPFCGRAVQGGIAVYVTSEGILGVRRRLVAHRREMGLEGKRVPFALIPAMPNLGVGAADREVLEADIKSRIGGIDQPPRIIIIDTLRRATPGKSESDSKDMSIFVDNCEALAKAFRCLVVTAHHSPRSDDARSSGSNAIDAAADVMWSVTRDPVTHHSTACVVRCKDGEEGDTWTFGLRPVELANDRNGNVIRSCVVEIGTEPERRPGGASSRPRLSEQQQRVFDILRTATAEAGQAGLAGDAAPKSMRAITRATLKAYAKTAGWWDDGTPKQDESSRARLNARLNELATKRVIGLNSEHVWPAI